MVYYDIQFPAVMPGDLLDDYLAKGWYRMQQTIFTTDLIIHNDLMLPVFWLRLVLGKYIPSRSGRKIEGLNKNFRVSISNGVITAETEALYKLYRAFIDFDISESVQNSLVGEATDSIFNTRCIEVRDGYKLIAAGYFDEADTSIAGILNIWHPDYKKYSLGKYLMLLKITYALQHHKQFYYPGYIGTGFAKFDYKLFPCREATEVYIRSINQWLPWLSVTKEELERILFSRHTE